MSAEEKAELARSKELEAAARREQAADAQKLKLLLLGAGESGKSTLFKQMKILFSQSHGFTQSEIQASVKIVYNNILKNMKILLSNCETHSPAHDSDLADHILSLDEGTPIDTNLGDMLKAIWEDAGVQDTWNHRSNFQVQDALEYFMENIDRIKQPSYLPDNQDILRSRVRTTGIVEAEFNLNGVRVAMFDVGGQRNERRKWIHCFEDVTAVIFVAAINEYDQVLFEDARINRMDEAVILFEEICNSKWFVKTAMILFLNKRDLFREKLITSPFRIDDGPDARFGDYTGPQVEPGTPSATLGTDEYEKCYEGAANYCLQLFLSRKKNPTKKVYHHITCATDTSNLSAVFNACKDIILKANLVLGGFFDTKEEVH